MRPHAARPLRIALALLCALWCAGVAWAHPQIVRIEPAPDSRLERAPGRVLMVFNEPIESLSRIELLDSAAHALAQGGARDPADPARLMLELPPLGPGLYTVVWTVAGSDGHVVRGNFSFTVLGAAAAAQPAQAPTAAQAPVPTPPAAGPPAAAPAPPVAQALLRWALLLGACGAVGGWLFWAWVALPALAGPPPAPAARRWRAVVAALLLLTIAGTLLLLADYVYEATGAITPGALWGAAIGTRQGQAGLARVGLAAALLALVFSAGAPREGRAPAALAGAQGRAAPRRPYAALALALAAALLLSVALAGHAAAEAAPLLPVLLAWLHLAASSLWAGGLLAFALTLGPLLAAQPAERRAPLLAALVGRFSPLALAGVALLTLSGLAAALRELRSPADLGQTAYGQALLAKLLLFGGMLAFGAYHLARRAAPPARLQRSLGGEALLATLTLLAAGMLTSLPPPVSIPTAVDAIMPSPTAARIPTVTPGPTRTPVPSRPFDQTLPAGELRVRLRVAPASLGANRFLMSVTDADGRQVAAQLVRLSFAMREMDMGLTVLEATPQTGADYLVAGSPLSMVGHWQITVLVRRAGLPDVEATFEVPVGEG